MPMQVMPQKSALRATAEPFHSPGSSGHQAVTNSSSPISLYTPTGAFDPLPASESIASSRTTPPALPWITKTHLCLYCSAYGGRASGSTTPIFNWTNCGKKAGTANIWEVDPHYCPYNQDLRMDEHPFPDAFLASKNVSSHNGEQRVDRSLEPGLLMGDEDEYLLPEELRRELGMEVPEHAVRLIDMQDSAPAPPAGQGRNGNGLPLHAPLELGFTSHREDSAWGKNKNILGSHSETEGAGTSERSSRPRATRRADTAYEIRYMANFRRIMGRDM